MIEETLIYHAEGTKFLGRLYTLEKTKRPLVLVAHAWMGQDDFALEQAKKLAERGYAALALDNYGNGKRAANTEEASSLMHPLFIERAELRHRMIAGLEAARNLHWISADKIAAIGFCFGGMSVLELLRSGAPVKGVVSIHGLLGYTLVDLVANKEPIEQIRGSALVLHGAEDPLVPWEDVKGFADEMNEAKANWEIDIYGQAKHAFTNPQAHDNANGLVYNEQVASRAFTRINDFLEECFNS